MKRMVAVMAILLVILIASEGFAEDLKLDFDLESIYAKLGVIVGFNYAKDLVFVADWNGNILSFYGIEDWAVWDYVSMVFYENGTPMSIYDDVILSVHYERVDLVQAQVLDSIRNAYPQYH